MIVARSANARAEHAYAQTNVMSITQRGRSDTAWHFAPALQQLTLVSIADLTMVAMQISR